MLAVISNNLISLKIKLTVILSMHNNLEFITFSAVSTANIPPTVKNQAQACSAEMAYS